MQQPKGRKPSGNKEIGAGRGTEDPERSSTSRKLKGEISNCPRHSLPISQLCKFSTSGGTTARDYPPPEYVQEMTD